jgi:hypothetical protein
VSGISKLEAAQRQLDCAIRLRIAREDSLAAHTLGLCCLPPSARAARRGRGNAGDAQVGEIA